MQLRLPEEFNKQEIESLHSELDQNGLAEEADLDGVSSALGRTRKQIFCMGTHESDVKITSFTIVTSQGEGVIKS